ncbi:MAG: Kelch repeat-containing protein [Candidatus Binataceae bacterium]
MRSRRSGATAILIATGRDAGKVLIIGGNDKDTRALASTELYDPATHSFVRGPSMHGARAYPTATLLTAGPRAGEVLITGGEGRDPDDNLVLASTELYDPVTRRFAPGPNLHTGRLEHTATPIAVGPNKGSILIAGGLDYDHNALASTELYDPWSNHMLAGPSMKLPRAAHTATVIVAGRNSGRILIAGGGSAGYGESGVYSLASTELFDPMTARFLPGPTMKSARELHTATALNAGPDAGKILIAGGRSADGDDLSSTEFYDPERNAFAPGPTMIWDRAVHTATAIGSGPGAGKILISGGTERVPNIPSDLYDPATNTFAPEGYVPERHGGCFDTFAIQLPPGPPHHSHR